MYNSTTKLYLNIIKDILRDPLINDIDDLRFQLQRTIQNFEEDLELVPLIVTSSSEYELKIREHDGTNTYVKTGRLFILFDYEKKSQNFIDKYLLKNIKFLTYQKRNDYFLLPHLYDYLCKVYQQPKPYNQLKLFKKIKDSLLNTENKPLFCRQSDMIKMLGLSNSGSLQIRIQRFNESNHFPIAPFVFKSEGNPDKIFYLCDDAKRLVDFCEKKAH